MAKIDPAQERRRLAAFYESKSDLELQKIGANPAELTSWAREALGAEMIRRGLNWPPPSPAEDVLAHVRSRKLRILRRCKDQSQAAKDIGVLRDSGIEPFFSEDDTGPGELGLLVLVRDKDLDSAQRALTERDALESMKDESSAEERIPSKPVVLRRYRDITEAMVDKTTLDAAGIECYLYDDNLVRLDWFISNAIGGVKLVVAENLADEAAKVLEEAVQPNQENAQTS